MTALLFSHLPSPLARGFGALRHWLRHPWTWRPLLRGYFQGLGALLPETGNGRRRHLPKRRPRPPVSLDLLVLEGRFSPIDVIGLGVSALGMPLATPGMILLEGWLGPRTAHAAAGPRLPSAGRAAPLWARSRPRSSWPA
jgi:hypothetical protein